MNKRFIRKGVFGIMLAVLLISSIAVIPVLAQEDSGTPTPQERAEEYLGKVAGKLGILTDDLRTACSDVHLEMLDEAVANGIITQERTDEIKARIAENGSACFGFGMPFMRRGPAGPGGPMQGSVHMGMLNDAVENGLITQEQADAITALGEQIREQLREQVQDRLQNREGLGIMGGPHCLLDDAVENGLITQEQADQINSLGQEIGEQLRQQMRERIDEGAGMMRGFGQRMRGAFGRGCSEY